MVKNILAAIGVIAIVAVIGAYTKFGGMYSQIQQLDEDAIPTYMEMFTKVLDSGNAATGMVNDYKINDDVSNEDAAESVKALAEEFNMRVTGETKMFTLEDAKGSEIKHARIISLCSLNIAKQFLNFSRPFGAFMPCRIVLIERADGDRRLYTMNLDLVIHGGHPLPPEMLKQAEAVRTAMTEIPSRAAEGDF